MLTNNEKILLNEFADAVNILCGDGDISKIYADLHWITKRDTKTFEVDMGVFSVIFYNATQDEYIRTMKASRDLALLLDKLEVISFLDWNANYAEDYIYVIHLDKVQTFLETATLPEKKNGLMKFTIGGN